MIGRNNILRTQCNETDLMVDIATHANSLSDHSCNREHLVGLFQQPVKDLAKCRRDASLGPSEAAIEQPTSAEHQFGIISTEYSSGVVSQDPFVRIIQFFQMVQ
jgi:hypothetical protein